MNALLFAVASNFLVPSCSRYKQQQTSPDTCHLDSICIPCCKMNYFCSTRRKLFYPLAVAPDDAIYHFHPLQNCRVSTSLHQGRRAQRIGATSPPTPGLPSSVKDGNKSWREECPNQRLLVKKCIYINRKNGQHFISSAKWICAQQNWIHSDEKPSSSRGSAIPMYNQPPPVMILMIGNKFFATKNHCLCLGYYFCLPLNALHFAATDHHCCLSEASTHATR